MQILRTYLFLIPLVVLLLSEIVKMLVDQRRTGEWHAPLFRPGGMPSSHSAFVTSLLIVVGRKLGVESTEFAISFVFAAIVWYDAMSARRELGEQAAILNRLQQWKHLKERLGHSFIEVVAGIAFGAVVTMVGIWVSA
ncbi:MAG: divergent PAP2 family protein [Candidatus Peribacteraceae bacterium]|nr:divergent PAP2 family protein [Candidatus Peribacteraceae bacterium]